MNLPELRNSIASKENRNLYIFYGKEYVILDIYMKKVQNLVSSSVTTYESIVSFYKTLDKKDILSKGSQVVIIRDDKDFLNTEYVWKDLISKLKKKNITLIAKYSTIDQRSKFYKQFEQYITEFAPLSTEVLTKYIKKEVDLENSYCSYLCDITQNDYGRILLELDKIKNLSDSKHMSNNDAFKVCYNANMFYCDAEGEVYDFINAIMFKDIKSIYYLLQESKDRNDNPIMILSLLHNNVKALLQMQLAGDIKDLSEKTGLTGFQIKNAKQFLGKYNNRELSRFMKYLKYCEKSIKTGVLSSDLVIDYLLVNIL